MEKQKAQMENPKKVLIAVPGPLMERIADWRFDNRIETQSEAIRQILTKGMDALDENTNNPN